jgi:hypothetical protein
MKYKYNDAEYWLEYMTPAEAAFLILFSYYYDSTMDVNIQDGTKEIEFDDSDEKSYSFETCIGFKDTENFVWLDGAVSGYTQGGSSGSYWEPPDPGEDILDDVNVDNIFVTTPVEEALELTDLEVKNSDSLITYKDIDNMARRAISEIVRCEDDKLKITVLKEIPAPLVEKIERVREENKRTIQAKMLGKKFGV